MAGTPYRMDDTATLVIDAAFAVELLEEIKKAISKRTCYPINIGEHDGGFWQVEQVATRRTDAGYDDIVATFRRALL